MAETPTHTFELIVNGTNLSGTIAFMPQSLFEVVLQGDINMTNQEIADWNTLMTDLSRCFEKFTTLTQLEISKI